jgi:hypothetical protein
MHGFPFDAPVVAPLSRLRSCRWQDSDLIDRHVPFGRESAIAGTMEPEDNMRAMDTASRRKGA